MDQSKPELPSEVISILDTYHRNKYVRKAAGGDDIQMRRLLDALRAGDRIATAKELKACYEKAETEGHRKSRSLIFIPTNC